MAQTGARHVVSGLIPTCATAATATFSQVMALPLKRVLFVGRLR